MPSADQVDRLAETIDELDPAPDVSKSVVEEFGQPNGEGGGEPIKRLQGGVPPTHLNPGDVAAVQIGLLGESLLGPLLCVPQFSHSAPQAQSGALDMTTAADHLAIIGRAPTQVSRLIVTIDLS